jgi:hypothetical protein
LATWTEALAWSAAAFSTGATLLRLAVVPVLSDYWDEPTRASADRNYADRLETAAANVFSFGWVTFIATIVLLMILWFRVLAQARAFGAVLPLGPGWAVGSWFIPLASFVLTVLVAGTVLRVAEWRGNRPIGQQWKERRFPLWVFVPPVAVVLSVLAQGREGAIERESFASDVLAQLAGTVSTGAWVLALVATAVIVRRTRNLLMGGPLVRWEGASRTGEVDL